MYTCKAMVCSPRTQRFQLIAHLFYDGERELIIECMQNTNSTPNYR